MALWVERQTCSQEVVGLSLSRARGLKTLGKFLTRKKAWFMCGWQVKLCDPLVTGGPYLRALEIRSL